MVYRDNFSHEEAWKHLNLTGFQSLREPWSTEQILCSVGSLLQTQFSVWGHNNLTQNF